MKKSALSRLCLSAAIGAALGLGAISNASAEAGEVRFAQQFGLLYLPMHVVVDQKLVQGCAKQNGLGDIKVTMHRFSGGAAVNQALLSGNVDFAAGGIGPLLKLWDKTKGRLNVRAMTTLAAMPLKLNTNDDRVGMLEDYVDLDEHKIATPSVKVSIQAVVLQMAAARKWGQAEAFKLDDMTVSMKHPTAMAALMAGGQAVKSHFATLPTSWAEVQSGKVKTVLTSYDVLGGRHSTVAMYNQEDWKKGNPKLYECVWKSYRTAIDWLNQDKQRGAELYHRFTKSKLKKEDVVQMLTTEGEMHYSLQPERTMEFAKFLHSIKAIKNMPESWKDYYWENNYDQSGSLISVADATPSGAVEPGSAAPPRAILDVQGVTLQYKTKDHLIAATYRVDFQVFPSDRFVLLGPSGCGKSTLLKGVAGYLTPVEGEMQLKGRTIQEPGPDRVMVFQEFDQLLPWKTVKQNITFALMNGKRCSSRREADEIARQYIRKVKLDRFEDTYPHMLSGGMKQRVAIARGMAMEPDILLMDEPFAALDALTRRQMQEELLQLWEDTHFTVLFVTHSIEEAIIIGSRILVLSPHPGQVKAELNAHHLFHTDVGEEEFSALQKRIHDMLFADRILEEEAQARG